MFTLVPKNIYIYILKNSSENNFFACVTFLYSVGDAEGRVKTLLYSIT